MRPFKRKRMGEHYYRATSNHQKTMRHQRNNVQIPESEVSDLHEDVAVHVFTVSAGMVGVCLTTIGLIRVVVSLRHITTIADDLLAGDALLFLISCLASYSALRTRAARRLPIVERIADGTFLVGMVLMVVVCAIIAFELEVQPSIRPTGI